MLNSSMYGLSNPALNEDIGQAYIGTPMPYSPYGFCGGQLSGVKLKGNIQNDAFEKTQKEKDKSFYKKLLIGAGIIAGGILCFKGGKKLFAWIGKQFQKLKLKFKK